jgi:hypothetical protein
MNKTSSRNNSTKTKATLFVGTAVARPGSDGLIDSGFCTLTEFVKPT